MTMPGSSRRWPATPNTVDDGMALNRFIPSRTTAPISPTTASPRTSQKEPRAHGPHHHPPDHRPRSHDPRSRRTHDPAPAADDQSDDRGRRAPGRPGARSTRHRPTTRASPFAIVAQRLVAAGQRPQVRVEVIGINGVLVTLTVAGMPGPIARARTRRRAREIARATVAAVLGLDPYAFDLEVHGA